MSSIEDNNDIILADGWESAFLGIGIQFNKRVAVYDLGRIIKILVNRDQMTYEEAREYIDFNITGAYVGPNTPVFLEYMDIEYLIKHLKEREGL